MLFEGKYFDGLSSAPFQVSVNFDFLKNKIFFKKENEDFIYWDISQIQFNNYGNLFEIRNKKNLDSVLKIDDENFSQFFFQEMKKNRGIDIHTQITNAGFLKISIITFFLFASFSCLYFYVLPPIAEKSVALLPQTFDNYIGDMVMNDFIDQNKIDNEKTEDLQNFAEKLYLAETKKLEFTVVKSNKVNAFALPNGQIVIYSAILEKIQSYDQLAALIGHEVSHVNNRHSIKALSKSLAGYMMISLLFNDVNGIMSVLAENVQQIHSLSYSREFEQEADEYGLKILINNNLDPYAMVELFEQLEKESEFSISEIMSTHPLIKNRKEYMQKIIQNSDYTVKTNNQLSTIFESLKE